MFADEPELLEMIAAGDERAFRVLFRRYYPKVLVLLRRCVPRGDAAEDMAIDIFAKIWSRRAMLPEIRSFGAYLFRMVRNALADYGRRHRIDMELLDESIPGPPSPDSELLARETSTRIGRLIDRMPPKRREVFLLSREEHLSNDEIALRMNISKKTVENHLNAALKEIRRYIS